MEGECGDDQNPYCDDRVPYAPADFCCQKDSSCLLVAANTTVICCPPGWDCKKIGSISCDPGALTFPSEIQSTVRHGNLTECNNECCPWGYFCNAASNCELFPDQAKASPGAELSSSKTSSTRHPKSSSTSSSTSPSTTPPTSSSSSTSTSLTTSDTLTTASTTSTTYASSYETPSIIPSVGPLPLPGSNETTNQTGAAPSTNKGTWIAVGSCLGFALLVLVIYSIIRVRKSTKRSREDRDQNNDDHGYPVGTSVYGQGGMSELDSPKQPANPYAHQGQLGSSNIYELSG
ncbi:hypothetical protein F4776DRAFT_673065 [Hypoxylon sp. NC0597]|nr:hypothetical protein F4776DRAFT_673065 [Hypoxylon sp. NC0597]